MGYIKEPKGVDFLIKSKPLTEKDKKEISKFIEEYKREARKGKSQRKEATRNDE